MTDTATKGDLIEQKIDRVAAGAVAVATEFGGLRIQNMLEVMEMAKLMAVSHQAVPAHLRNNPGMCLAICLTALEWKMSPFAVANKSYVTNDRLNYESQLVHAVIEARAPLRERLKVRYEGEGDDRVCIVFGTFRGEDAPREHRSPRLADCIPPKNEYGKVKGSPLWAKKPDVQLFYDTSRDFCRIYCPDVLLGIYTPDEVEQYGIGEDAKDITAGASLHERLKNTPKSGEGFSDDAVTNGLKDHPVADGQQGNAAPQEAAGAPGTSEASTQGATAENTPRKPGGRPKGSKNKPKGEAAAAASEIPPETPNSPEIQRPQDAGEEPEENTRWELGNCATAADYIAYAAHWIDTTTDDRARAQGRWDNELDTRNALKVPVVDRAKLQARIDARFQK